MRFNLKSIFSISNVNVHKVFNFCGLKLKFKSNKLILRNTIKNLEKKIKLCNENIKKQNDIIKQQEKEYNILNSYQEQNILLINKKFNNLPKINFSVIMPSFNRAFCIQNAINSLLANTYQNFELIIIDDGSTDNTEELIKQTYSQYLENKKIIYKLRCF